MQGTSSEGIEGVREECRGDSDAVLIGGRCGDEGGWRSWGPQWREFYRWKKNDDEQRGTRDEGLGRKRGDAG